MGYVANPRPGSGFPPERTLTKLGMLRESGTVDIDRGVMRASGGLDGHREGLGVMDPRRSLALMRQDESGRFIKPTGLTAARARIAARYGITPARRGGAAAARARQMAQTRAAAARARLSRTDVSRPKRRGGIGGIFGRMRARTAARAKQARERQKALDAERKASEAAQIAEAERLARETVMGPPQVTDRNGQAWTMLACRGGPPDRRAGWKCLGGQWRYQMPGGGFGPQRPPPREITNGAPAPMEPSVRPWWMGQPKDGDIPTRDTSGIPPPPGLPGGPSMRPPGSRDTATEVVGAEAPAAGMDMAKILPLVAGAALMFMGKG